MNDRHQSILHFQISYDIEHVMRRPYLRTFFPEAAKKDISELRYTDQLCFARFGTMYAMVRKGPKPDTGELIPRQFPVHSLFNGRIGMVTERPDWVDVSSSFTVVGPDPFVFGLEKNLLKETERRLKELSPGERLEIRQGQPIEGGPTIIIEIGNETGYTLYWLQPELMFAVVRVESHQGTHVTRVVEDCRYRLVDGVPFLERAILKGYSTLDAKQPINSSVYSLRSIETSKHKIDRSLFQLTVRPDANYFDIEKNSPISSPEQVQLILDDIASEIPKMEPRSYLWVYLSVGGILAAFLLLFLRRRRVHPPVIPTSAQPSETT